MLELRQVRLAAFYIAFVIAGVVCLGFVLSGATVDKSYSIVLEQRVNPNDAPAASLARLPGLGLSRANAIVEYRRQFQREGLGELAFRDCNDLVQVKGIGPATAENLCEWLRFR
jgi:competence protein ComEA